MKYVGEFKDSNRHGQGTQTWPSQGKYVGEWKYGKRHGQGIMSYTDGTVDKGQFINDIFMYYGD